MDNSIIGSGGGGGGGGGGGSLLLSPSDGIFDLDSAFHRNTSQQRHLPHQVLDVGISSAGLDHEQGMPLKGVSLPSRKTKPVAGSAVNYNCPSDDDELGFREEGSDPNSNGGKGKKGSPWQRMKWTDDVVRLLITTVACVEEDGVNAEGPADGPVKRKSGALQKKGKWKAVSKMMMERGCYISPQQCEDKFNDLNKRYKRLNEILGRGTTCRVVENPSLLDSMAHLTPKIKDDVRKILSSKHLFYREMCAFHTGQRICETHEVEPQGYPMVNLMQCTPNNDQFDGDEDEDDEDSDDDVENEVGPNGDVENADRNAGCVEKKTNCKDGSIWLQSNSNYGVEPVGMVSNVVKLPWDQPEWLRGRALQLLEQKVNVQAQAFDLEQRRFKWQRFCRKKDKELDRLRLENERMRLENEQIALQLKQKEIEMDLRKSDVTLQGREQMDLGTLQ